MISHLFNKSTGNELLDKYIEKYPCADHDLLLELINQEEELTQLLNEKRILVEKSQVLKDAASERLRDNTFRKYLENVTKHPAGWYESVPEPFKGSVYETYRREIEGIVQGNLSEKVLSKFRENALYLNSVENELKHINPVMVLYCDSIINSEQGPRLILSDPYGTITTTPMENVSYDLAKNWIGLVLVCNTEFKVTRSGKVSISVSSLRIFARSLERK